MDTEIQEKLKVRAQAVRKNAYAPISHFKVGAAFRTARGTIYAGCNVEEAAFTSSIHAEQGAVAQMVATEGKQQITDLVVVAGAAEAPPVTPCGHCRQFLGEFITKSANVVCFDETGALRFETTYGELFPHGFSMQNIEGDLGEGPIQS